MNTSAALLQQVYYTSTQWNPSTTTGVASVEFRMSLGGVMEDSANDNVIVFTMAYGSGGTAFYLGENGLTLFPGSGTPLVADFDPTETHTYRVIFNTTNATFSLDIDGIRKVSDHALSTVFASNVLRIGDSSSSVGGIMRYEYIAWDNSSAPIPEPAAALLIPVALGAVALSRSRRNRSTPRA